MAEYIHLDIVTKYLSDLTQAHDEVTRLHIDFIETIKGDVAEAKKAGARHTEPQADRFPYQRQADADAAGAAYRAAYPDRVAEAHAHSPAFPD